MHLVIYLHRNYSDLSLMSHFITEPGHTILVFQGSQYFVNFINIVYSWESVLKAAIFE